MSCVKNHWMVISVFLIPERIVIQTVSKYFKGVKITFFAQGRRKHQGYKAALQNILSIGFVPENVKDRLQSCLPGIKNRISINKNENIKKREGAQAPSLTENSIQKGSKIIFLSVYVQISQQVLLE